MKGFHLFASKVGVVKPTSTETVLTVTFSVRMPDADASEWQSSFEAGVHLRPDVVSSDIATGLADRIHELEEAVAVRDRDHTNLLERFRAQEAEFNAAKERLAAIDRLFA